MSQRIGLAQAILGNPTLVILDEPTSALDPVGRREVRELIRGLRDAGTAVLLNSHLLGEVESVCDRVAVLDRGAVVFEGPLDGLTGATTRHELRVDVVDGDLVDRLGVIGDVEVVDHTTVTSGSPIPCSPADLAAAVVGSGHRLLAMIPIGSTLEDVFVTMVRGGDR